MSVTLAGVLPVFGQPSILIRNATIIDGAGGPPIVDGAIAISGSKIAQVGPAAGVQTPAGAREIDAAGKFVIPGLMDANVHLVLNMTIEFHARYEDRYEDLIEEAAQVALRNGVTTVFDTWGPLGPLMNVRDRINRGEVAGSRMFVAGNIVGLSGPLGPDFNQHAATAASQAFVKRINQLYEENTGPDLLWRAPEQVRAEVRKYIARGVDFLKYAAAGHGRGRSSFLMFSPETQRAIVEECHRAGIVAQTHAMTVESLRQGIEAGADMGQHVELTGPEPMPDGLIKLMLARKFHAAVQPFTARRRNMMIEDASDPEEARQITVSQENIVRLIKSGVPLLLASDGGLRNPDEIAFQKPRAGIDRPFELREGPFLWLQAMSESGMAPMAAIQAATRNVAAAYRKLDTLGTIEKGKTADLVVLDADPLQDINNVRKIALVIKDGRIVDRDALPLKKVLTAPRPQPRPASENGR
ncbi:MAG: amidohydrolase family protein [Bryobacteraceae bacterium]|nr:amidohydrolase family protein [Bryobacteraceae bacterium]